MAGVNVPQCKALVCNEKKVWIPTALRACSVWLEGRCETTVIRPRRQRWSDCANCGESISLTSLFLLKSNMYHNCDYIFSQIPFGLRVNGTMFWTWNFNGIHFLTLICSKALRQGWLFSLGSCLVEGLTLGPPQMIGKYRPQLKSVSSVIRDTKE